MATNKLKDIALQGARGWAAGLAGLPGDIEGLARMAIKYGASPGSYVDRNMSDTPALPTSEFYKEWMPGGDWETPEGGLAQDVGALLGGVGSTKLAGLAQKYGTAGAKIAAKNAMAPATLSKQAGVIKAPGGNWLSGSVEDALKGLKRNDSQAIYDRLPAGIQRLVDAEAGVGVDDLAKMHPKEWAAAQDPLDSWIDKQLTKYVKNDMATERDPIRALAERGVLHYEPQPTTGPVQRAMEHRADAKQPTGGHADSDLARHYETMTDSSIGGHPAGDWMKNASPAVLEKNQWLAKVPPEVPVYEKTSPGLAENLGFPHLIDELRNATNPNSGLPADLLLKYEALDRVSVPQAVERVAKINAWREAQKVEANAAKANNAATVLHKEYPEQGMKWVELKKSNDLPQGYSVVDASDKVGQRFAVKNPEGQVISYGETKDDAIFDATNRDGNPNYNALADALKYEGDTMGHCVGGYCDDVASGASRIFSLRDKKGQPHVTVEVKPKLPGSTGSQLHYYGLAQDEIAAGRIPVQRVNGRVPMEEVDRVVAELKKSAEAPSESILQIKGKGNRKPNDEYLPFVQDFVKSGKWSDVGDLQNTGMVHADSAIPWPKHYGIEDVDKVKAELGGYSLRKHLEDINSKYTTPEAFHEWLGAKGFAQGGLVTQNNDYDPSKVDALVAQLQAEFA